MSTLTIATLPRMQREELSELVLSATETANFAIVDVRDSVDHIGGHIFSSIWAPSASLDARLPELIRTLSDKKKVIFHCALSQQRGPSAALRYARQRAALLAPEQIQEQQIYVLEGGFMSWQELYGTNPKLTEAYIADIWKNY
ncbi:Rhodanese-like protein [Ascosphaera apis ARSEF 7405]|uniref:Rhodanese-like protein n=1 Tax=Ascosphaera apis ARSEF 7405 TaxID=392613 RepID=A0A167WUI9_9EURO|nr:Rhodanese-like protein [Ascosphaera apis ARSEF 7405]